MKKITSGQANISGINAWQYVVSMSLFLQYLRDPKFLHIHLEDPGFQDFNMVFDDGHKIICESKDRKEKFNYVHLRSVLKNIKNSKAFDGQDEILIICRNVSESLVSNIKNIRYFEQLEKVFKNKGYDEKDILLLPKVKFWIVPSTFNEKVIYSLFSDLINFWLPSGDIERIVDHILVEKIYKGSAKGNSYGKIDILKEISDLATEAKNNSVYYGDDLKKEREAI